MGLNLSEKAERYRQLSRYLSNPEDVAAALQLAAQLDDIARLEVPVDQAIAKSLVGNTFWLKEALAALCAVPATKPLIFDILFSEMLSPPDEPDARETDA